MTKEDKELLLKDLCARLPYGVKISHRGDVHQIQCISPSGEFKNYDYDAWFPIESCKPYLRPMSSMTEEEKRIYREIQDYFIDDSRVKHYFECIASLDYLNSIHVDFRGLIPLGLALEAPDGMYHD